jgi:hypothetical protein
MFSYNYINRLRLLNIYMIIGVLLNGIKCCVMYVLVEMYVNNFIPQWNARENIIHYYK